MAPLLLILVLALSLALLAIAMFTFSVILSSYRIHRHLLAQGIFCYPFIPLIGHMRRLVAYRKAGRSIAFLEDAWRAHGLLHSISMGPSILLRVNDPAYFQDIFRNKASCYHKPSFSKLSLGEIIGTSSLILAEGEEHARHRRMINPAFHHHNIRDMQSIMVQETAEQIDEWLTRIPQPSSPSSSPHPFAVIELHRALSTLTLSIVASCAFGPGLKSIPNAFHIVTEALEKSLDILMRRLTLLVAFIPWVRDWPILGRVEQVKARSEMVELVRRVIAERREGKTGSTREGKLDLLDLLLSARDPQTGEQLTDAEVSAEAMTFVLAGHETTANLMSWTLYILMTRPALWAACVEEVRGVCGNEPPTYEQLAEMRVVEAVLNETLRLLPPVPLVGREVVKEHTIGEGTAKPLHLPLGVMVQVGAYIVHRSKEHWGEDAEQFDHTRWLRPAKPYSHPFAFIPFSIGSRNCIGLNFAQSAHCTTQHTRTRPCHHLCSPTISQHCR